MRLLSDCMDIFITAPFYAVYLWVAGGVCETCLESPGKNKNLFAIFSFTVWLILNVANRRYSFSYMFFLILNHSFFIGLVLLLFQADREKKILAASVLTAVLTLTENFCWAFLACITLIVQHTIKKSSQPLVSEWEAGMISCFSLAAVTVAVYWLSKHLTSVFYGKPGRWYVILAVPLFVLIALIDVAGWGASNGIMVKGRSDMGLYYDQIFSYMGSCVLTGLSMFAAGVYVFGMDRIYLEQERNSRYHWQIAIYKMLEEHYRQSERLRHDMKNHVIALTGLARGKEWEKVESYLEHMEDTLWVTNGDITGNKAVDALLYQKKKQAEREHIKWECDVQIPKIWGIHEFELCILFGNLLDNALEACGRMEEGSDCFVSIKAKAVKKCFLLEIKNSMNPGEEWKNSLKNNFTKKGIPREHGIGLLNVNDVIHNYQGTLNIEMNNGIFEISVLIPYMTPNSLFETRS